MERERENEAKKAWNEDQQEGRNCNVKRGKRRKNKKQRKMEEKINKVKQRKLRMDVINLVSGYQNICLYRSTYF
jgi:hypothetical protein